MKMAAMSQLDSKTTSFPEIPSRAFLGVPVVDPINDVARANIPVNVVVVEGDNSDSDSDSVHGDGAHRSGVGGSQKRVLSDWEKFELHIKQLKCSEPSEKFKVKPLSNRIASNFFKTAIAEVHKEVTLARLDSSIKEAFVEEGGRRVVNGETIDRLECRTEFEKLKCGENITTIGSSRSSYNSIKIIEVDPHKSRENGVQRNSRTELLDPPARLMRARSRLSTTSDPGRFSIQNSREEQQRAFRMIMYEKYIDRPDSWSEGLTSFGKNTLTEVQRKRAHDPRLRSASVLSRRRATMNFRNAWSAGVAGR